MNREEKQAFVAALKENLQDKSIAIITRQSGLTVSEVSELRAKIREVGAYHKVTKNTLARLAVNDTPFEGLAEHFVGPTSLSTAVEPVSLAKTLVEFAKGNEKIEIIGGVLDGKVMNKQSIEALAKLPSMDQLRGMLVGVISAPATKMARLLKEPATQLGRVVKAYSEK